MGSLLCQVDSCLDVIVVQMGTWMSRFPDLNVLFSIHVHQALNYTVKTEHSLIFSLGNTTFWVCPVYTGHLPMRHKAVDQTRKTYHVMVFRAAANRISAVPRTKTVILTDSHNCLILSRRPCFKTSVVSPGGGVPGRERL